MAVWLSWVERAVNILNHLLCRLARNVSDKRHDEHGLTKERFDNYGGVAQMGRASRKHPESSSFVGLRGMCLTRDMTSMV